MKQRSIHRGTVRNLARVLFFSLSLLLTSVASASAAAPTIESTSVTNVSTSYAVLHATINPNGLLTKYKLQIDVTGNFKFDQNDGCELHPPGIGCTQALVDGEPQPAGLSQPPESELAAGISSQDVAAVVGTLQPNTTYYYRAIAANSNGFTYGPTQTFTTPAGSGPPTIIEQYVSGVSPHDATLHARINPNGLKTYYELQIDTTGNFKFDQSSSCPLEEAPMVCLTVMEPGDPLAPGLVQPPEYTLAASSFPEDVSVNMASIGATLQPNTTYHYRAIAANGEELVEGPEQTFTTEPFSQDPADPPVDPGQDAADTTLQASTASVEQLVGTASADSQAKRSNRGKRCSRKKRNRRHAKASRLSAGRKQASRISDNYRLVKLRACRAPR